MKLKRIKVNETRSIDDWCNGCVFKLNEPGACLLDLLEDYAEFVIDYKKSCIADGDYIFILED